MPRYCPAVGGTEFHSRHLAYALAQNNQVTVVTHSDKNAVSTLSMTEQAATTETCIEYDGVVETARIGAGLNNRRILQFLGRHYSDWTAFRPVYQACFNYAIRSQVEPFIGKADVVHYIYNGLTDAACLARDLSKKHHVPFVFTPNVLDTSSATSPWRSRRFRSLYHSADQLIALTTCEAEWLESLGVAGSKINVIPYGPILSQRQHLAHNTNLKPLIDTPYVLFVGRLRKEKGYLLLVDAFSKLRERFSTLKLVIVAPELTAELASILDEDCRSGDDRIRFVENPEQSVKTSIITGATAMCVPSQVESLGGMYIEAMSCAVPVVALDLPVTRCVVRHEQEGLLVQSNPVAIASAIAFLLNNPDSAREMGLRGKARAENHFSWRCVTQKVSGVYRDAISAGRNSSLVKRSGNLRNNSPA